MVTLVEIISAPQRRDRIIADCVRQVEAHAAGIRGVRGIALRTGLSALKAVRADALPRATARLLPEVAAALDPLFQQSRAASQDFATFLEPRRAEAGAAILAVIDARAAASSNRALARVYGRLRGTLETELNRRLPDLVRSLGRQLE